MLNKIINWSEYVDAIYCLHYLPYKNRLKKIELNLRIMNILDSTIFKWYYTYPNKFDTMVESVIKPEYCDYHNKRRVRTLNLNIAYHNMFREIQELGYKKVLIIEDDCTIVYWRRNLLAEALKHLPIDWDYIQFDKVQAHNKIDYLKTLNYGDWFHGNYTGGYFGTCFTMWSDKAIEYAVRKQEEDLTIADHLFANRDDPELIKFNKYVPKYSYVYQYENIGAYDFS